jgi:ZIP family zinc transporter
VLLAVGGLVTASLVLGALAAGWLRLPEQAASMFTAFGGGILLAAVALELLPSADVAAGRTWTAVGLVAGAALYLGADVLLTRDHDMATTRRSGHAAASGAPMPVTAPAGLAAVARGETIAAGIVVDGIPESLALGLGVIAGEGGLALLAAVVLGNVTESYGAAQPLLAGGRSRRFTFGLISAIGVLLGATTVLGGTVVAGLPAVVVGTAQAVAAGAILAVLSISIIPYAFDEVNRRVAVAITLGVVAGYLLG